MDEANPNSLTSSLPSPAMTLPLTEEQIQLVIRLESIFMPNARKRRDEFYVRDPATGVVSSSARFVHYTSAEAALQIIRNKRMWMRNVMCMNDYREVQHGFEILQRFFGDPQKANDFAAALDSCAPGAAKEAFQRFGTHWPTTRFHTYIASISEHDSKEDSHGRLSMWRAFGNGTSRVALVFNIPWASGAGLALNLLFSPVTYLTEQETRESIAEVIQNIRGNTDFLKTLDFNVIVDQTFLTLLAMVTCLKHEGFAEEREWRAIYSPLRAPSQFMEGSTEVVAGVPQRVYSIPLDERVSPTIAGLEFSRIFDRLIIGPSQYARPMCDAFLSALEQSGVPANPQKVFISGIPIRT